MKSKGTYYQIINELNRLNINYKLVNHPAALTTEQADKYIKDYEGVRTKSMFLKDKHKNYYLLIMDDKKRLNFHKFQDLSGTKRISMAHLDQVLEQLGLVPGIISPFGLLNNERHNISVYFDKDMLKEKILTFHPNENTHTIFINTTDVIKFVTECGYDINIIDL